MYRLHALCAFFILLLLTAPAAHPYQAVTDDLIAIPIASPSLFLSFAELQANDASSGGTLGLGRDALFGSVSVKVDGFLYVPDASFWSAEVDSFVYTYTDGMTVYEAVVMLHVARFEEASVVYEDFENPNFVNNHFDDFEISDPAAAEIMAEAQLKGTTGILFRSQSGQPSYLVHPALDGAGGTGTGGGVHAGMGCIPSSGGSEDGGGGLYKDLVLLAIGGDPYDSVAPPALRVVMAPGNTVVLQGRQSGGAWSVSEPLPLPGDSAFIEVDWQPTDSSTYHVVMRVDGMATHLPLGVSASLASPDVYLGLMPTAGGTGVLPDVHLGWDSLKIFTTTADLKPSPVHTFDAFESGRDNVSMVGTGLDIHAGAAVSGNLGLEADATETGYLLDTKPAKTERLVSQFRVDLSQFYTTSGDFGTMFAFGHASAATTLDTRLRLRLVGGSTHEARLLATYLTAESTAIWSPSHPTSAGENVVTLQYRAATSAEHHNGYLRVWLDDQVIADFDDLDSVGQEAAWSHFGFYGNHPGTSGYLLFDEFVSLGY